MQRGGVGMRDFRCSNCYTLLFKGEIVIARVQAKCSKCNAMNYWSFSEQSSGVARGLDKASAPVLAS